MAWRGRGVLVFSCRTIRSWVAELGPPLEKVWRILGLISVSFFPLDLGHSDNMHWMTETAGRMALR